MTWMSTYRVTFYAARHRQQQKQRPLVDGRSARITDMSLPFIQRTHVWIINIKNSAVAQHFEGGAHSLKPNIILRVSAYCRECRDVYSNPPSSAAPGAEKAFSCSLPRSAWLKWERITALYYFVLSACMYYAHTNYFPLLRVCSGVSAHSLFGDGWIALGGANWKAETHSPRSAVHVPPMSDGFAHFVTQKGDRVKRVPLIKVRSTALKFQDLYVQSVLLYIESALDTSTLVHFSVFTIYILVTYTLTCIYLRDSQNFKSKLVAHNFINLA
jgi:hypothetical protein